MLRKAAARALWVTKGAALFGGAVVTLALVLGAASVALGANGGNLLLGQTNVASALTRLTGSVPGAQMEVQNNDPGANDTALSLKVQPGEPPMKVLSGAKVENLNADELDGLDPSQIKGARAYAVVDPDDGPGGTPGFDPSAPSGFNSVQRISTGIYCLKAPGRIQPPVPPWSRSTGSKRRCRKRSPRLPTAPRRVAVPGRQVRRGDRAYRPRLQRGQLLPGRRRCRQRRLRYRRALGQQRFSWAGASLRRAPALIVKHPPS